jgi:hypothetical protein
MYFRGLRTPLYIYTPFSGETPQVNRIVEQFEENVNRLPAFLGGLAKGQEKCFPTIMVYFYIFSKAA